MTADNDAFYFVGVSTEGKAQEILEACAIECATHTDDTVLGQVCGLVDKVGHSIHRVGYAHDYCLG